jgi:manganese-dependent inorganic pyrophosphatase
MSMVYIIGHKKPDTDSICSVIGYAEYLNRSEPGTYVAARCGDINTETEYVLRRCGVEPPYYLESVEPTVADLPFTYPLSAGEDMPTIEVVSMMDVNDMRNIPIINKEGILVGLISEYGLARTYVQRKTIEPLSISPIKLETLANILDAEIVVPGSDLLEGKVYIAIDALHVSLSRLTSNDVAIVGDNEPAQLALISSGIAALIVADNAPIGERAIAAARENNLAVLTTALDAFGVGKMINLSLPAKSIMATDFDRVRTDDSLDYVKELVTLSKYRTACIVDENERLLGMVSRNTFVDEIHKSVILLDHNEYSQAVDGIEKADILEIVDHHRLGAITTLRPIRFQNEPVGSTSTIITWKFMESGEAPQRSTAGLLLAGILSDTLVLKMSTTTPRDTEAVRYLAALLDIDPYPFGMEILEKGMDLENIPISELLRRDLKHYSLFGKNVSISQVILPTFEFCEVHGEEIRQELAMLKMMQGDDISIALFTSVFENASLLYGAAETYILEKMSLGEQPRRLDNVMSRKKDFLPQFGRMMKNM